MCVQDWGVFQVSMPVSFMYGGHVLEECSGLSSTAEWRPMPALGEDSCHGGRVLHVVRRVGERGTRGLNSFSLHRDLAEFGRWRCCGAAVLSRSA